MVSKYLIGGLVGFIFGVMLIPIEASIPPTDAIQTITVDTLWSGDNTDVNADVWNEQIYFVSDGSISFNVTETYP